MASVETVLLAATLSGSAAIALVAVLRRPLRHAAGARVAYGLWSMVPLAMLASLLPAPEVPQQAALVVKLAAMPASLSPQVQAAAAVGGGVGWVAMWSAGAIATLLLLLLQQRHYVRALGPLRVQGDCLVGDGVASPAVLGAWRPRVVLPADFEDRYDIEERRLVLSHERAHLRRGDARANALAAVILGLFWFNPLVHWALRCFRFDQELACDADVLQHAPQARQAYARAMLKTQLASDAHAWRRLPLGCHWQPAHPLKERIAMLKHPLPGRARRGAGVALTLALTASCGYVAWAAQPAASAQINVRAEILRLAAQTGLKVQNPERLAEHGQVTAAYRDMHPQAAIASIAEAVGLVPVERGDTLRFVPQLAPDMVRASLGLSVDGGAPSRLAVASRFGVPMSVRTQGKGRTAWDIEAVVTPAENGLLQFAATVSENGRTIATPTIKLRPGMAGRIQSGETAADGTFRGVALDVVLLSSALEQGPVASG